jgi:hypothetical protein
MLLFWDLAIGDKKCFVNGGIMKHLTYEDLFT